VLTPVVVAEAAESVGLHPSGRLFALNSYENRVYQLGDEDGALWVLKFYRPARWSDAAIAEEHEFTFDLAEAELPVAVPLVRDGRSLFTHGGLRFAAFAYLAGRPPELDDRDTLILLGRTLARMHAVGGAARFSHRPKLSVERLGEQSRDLVIDTGFVPEALAEQYARVSGQVIRRIRQSFDAFGPLPGLRIHGDCHAGNILWRANGPLFVDLDDCMSGPRIQDLWMFLAGDAASQQSSRCAACASSTTRPGSRSAGAIRPFRGPFPGLPMRASGNATSRTCSSSWRPWTIRRYSQDSRKWANCAGLLVLVRGGRFECPESGRDSAGGSC
jgi:Ser/Thr protein kinase RdoA (MazF antagonist)